ncbi:MAG: 3-hydroxyacyl-CoA dehydrogenase family protein [Spirochaetes bacterium]|nr:3-hydroxyacyl-CoA dehydrogenase family protein [Spirochaetota bacterium]
MGVRAIKKVTVIGSGAMGSGIAEVHIVNGINTVMVDINNDLLQKAKEKINSNLTFLVNKQKMTQVAMDEAMARLATSTDITSSVKDADCIIEAVPELMDLKKKIFKTVSDAARTDAIIASNTSSLSITELAETVSESSRFAGFHFFNPVNRMRLVEVIYGQKTSDEVIDTLMDLGAKLGKVAIKVLRDRPGFIVNRINAPLQPLWSAILDEGKISPASIDTVMKNHGAKMGPFELMDFVGLDVIYNVMQYYKKTLSPEWEPGKFITECVKKNELGMKTGKGIYVWEGGKAIIDSSIVTDIIKPIDPLAVQLNEAVRVLKEKVAASAEDIDKGQEAGMNQPGPFKTAMSIDNKLLAERLNWMSETYNLTYLKPEPEILDDSFKSFLR